MDSEERKLINEIRDGLYDFEIPYEDGNWEKFKKLYEERTPEGHRTRRKTLIIRLKYISAAALIGALVNMPWNDTEKVGMKQDRIFEQAGADTKEKEITLQLLNNRDTLVAPPSAGHPIGLTPKIASLTEPRLRDHVVIEPNASETVPPPISSTIMEDKATYPSWQKEPIATLESQGGYTPASGRWKFGLEVNSSLTTNRPNVAAGILAQFEVAQKIKLSTGLTYSRISAIHDTDPVQLSYDTKMVGTKSLIKAIDIPLSIVYEPTDGWYASVGVSALAVLDEDKFYRMESEVLQENVMMDPESGASISVFEVVKNEYSERSTDTDFEGRSNLRYLNLSIGRKQRFNKNTDLLFEPFIKIPMGGLQRGDVNLLNSGIKVKVLF
ncbi:hypothetical protein GCM10007415_34160 [Parapedobacter pyrenivorans]|uniref:Outer membrane protein beta-barrel domain-containing protein n=1 Tax=Parapedobacter pyrenivorans TaxID=1305674 RepID=A0A917HZF3_9SPHI|nr:hypothetical protein [Parapedobacter pyrenivorans]GGG96127.1 hypothetical protein GCM10007415_34160 [Parapedobacter pyrenivorans]